MSFWSKLKALIFGQPSPGAPPAMPSPPGEASPPQPDPWSAGWLIDSTPEERRAQMLSKPRWTTRFEGRTDVIPPAGDELTDLIDHNLVVGGYLDETELAELHEVGDQWLAQRQRARLVAARAARSANDAVAALRRERAEHKAERQRRAAEEKAARAEEKAWRRANDIIFLGRGVSGRLHDRRSHVEALEAAALPVMSTPAEVAAALEVTVGQLRWLCYHAEALERSHYVQFEVPKRSGGGLRRLAAPKSHLRAAQRWVLDQVLSKIEPHPAAHGFVPGRSTVTNAAIHQGRRMVINLDLEDFFPTITFPRVRGVFESMGYSPAVATVLALLCTESPRRPVTLLGRAYQVAVGDRCLPQGACTSPALSNLVARRLDQRLDGLARARTLRYSRYADDLTFSADADLNPGRLLATVRHIVEDEGFRINQDKVRVLRRGGRQTVTGLVVNDPQKLGLPRAEVRRLRAILHNAQRTGLAAQNRQGHPDFEAHLRGKLAYLNMVDPVRAAPLMDALDRVSTRR